MTINRLCGRRPSRRHLPNKTDTQACSPTRAATSRAQTMPQSRSTPYHTPNVPVGKGSTSSLSPAVKPRESFFPISAIQSSSLCSLNEQEACLSIENCEDGWNEIYCTVGRWQKQWRQSLLCRRHPACCSSARPALGPHTSPSP